MFFQTPFWRTPDAIEYLNVAQNLVWAKGLTQSIKWNFFDNSPVITSALKGKPILTSIIFFQIIQINSDPYSIQFFLLFLGACNVVLFYFLCRAFLRPKISFFTSILFALNPNILISGRLLLSEEIFYFFVIIAFIIFYRLKDSYYKFTALGIISGVSYLTRNEGLFLLMIFLFFSSKKRKVFILILILSFITSISPFLYQNFEINTNPFYTYKIFHFSVHHFSEGMTDGFGKKFPSSFSFISKNLFWVISAIGIGFKNYLIQLLGFTFLGPLSLVYILNFKKIPKKFLPIISFSLILFLTIVFVWALFPEPERHLSLSFILLLIPIFYFFEEKFLIKFLFVLTIFIYLGFDLHRIYWARNIESKQFNEEYKVNKNIYDWVKNNTTKDSVIANNDPWKFYFYTQRPSILIPNKLITHYCEFYDLFKPDFIVSDNKLFSGLKKYGNIKFKENGLYILNLKSCKKT